jgi:hypothetical protein
MTQFIEKNTKPCMWIAGICLAIALFLFDATTPATQVACKALFVACILFVLLPGLPRIIKMFEKKEETVDDSDPTITFVDDREFNYHNHH